MTNGMLVAGANMTPAAKQAMAKALEKGGTKGPYCVLEEIGPERAKELLAANKKNRGLSEGWVKSIARDILSGAWVIDGNPIRIGTNGNLFDGQHRLSAIVMANQPVKTFVVYGLDAKAMDNIDRGRSRSVADLFKLSECCSKDYIRAASISTHLYILETGNVNHSKMRVTYAEARTVYDREKDHIEWAVAKVGTVIEPGVPNGGSPTLAAFAYLHPVNPAKVEAFAARFKTGRGCNPGDPADALRRMCANFQRSAEGIRRTFLLRTLRAIEADLNKEKLTHLKVDSNIIPRARALRQAVP